MHIHGISRYKVYDIEHNQFENHSKWRIIKNLICKVSDAYISSYDLLRQQNSKLRIRIFTPSGLRRTSTSSPSWIFKFLVPVQRLLVFIAEVRSLCTKAMVHSLWTKTRTSAMTIRTGARDSKIPDGENVDVLRSPDPVTHFLPK